MNIHHSVVELPNQSHRTWSLRLSAETVLSYRKVIELWATSNEFRTSFSKTLSNLPCDGFFWETIPVSLETLDQAFECVCVEGLTLNKLTPDVGPFSGHFNEHKGDLVLTFPNLGHDAILVVPMPDRAVNQNCYPHFAVFLRRAPKEQIDAFWKTTGEVMQNHVSSRPTWLSTAGLGVSWLHLRLDSRPKYYRHNPYRDFQPT